MSGDIKRSRLRQEDLRCSARTETGEEAKSRDWLGVDVWRYEGEATQLGIPPEIRSKVENGSVRPPAKSNRSLK